MLDRRLVAGGAAIALVAVAMVAFVLLSPRWAPGTLNQITQQQLGRSFVATGGATLDFSPLSIRIAGPSLSGADARNDSFVSGGQLVIPVSFSQLISRKPSLSFFQLTDSDISLFIDERGQASWDFPGLKSFAPLQISLEQVRFRYFDARNNQSLTLSNVDGLLEVREDGGASFKGSAVVNSRVLRIDADLKSLVRIDGDGSPLELALAGDAGTASFSGRLSTAKVLSLTGPVSLSSTVPVDGLRLLGLPLPDGLAVAGPLTLDGALDSAGRAFAIRDASLTMGGFRASGDVVADLRGDQPKLQANLNADTIWLDPFIPAAGATGDDWGRTPLPFALLKTFDADVNIDARDLRYQGFSAAASRMKVTLAAGKLEVSSASRLTSGGTVSVLVKADASTLPPSVSLNVTAQQAEAQTLLTALAGISHVTGTGSFSADLAAQGQTQEELAGTLKGTASVALTGGQITGTDLSALFAATRQKILDGWQAAPGVTPFNNLGGEAGIADGIVSFRNFKIDTPVASFTAEGLIDILRRGVEFHASGTAGAQPILPVPVIVKGPWGAPRIYPDVPNILTNPEGGFARLQEVPAVEGN
ncbi:AsmA family protein [Aestuariivirga sp.]|uniref:AsmA family protein n=1 Tax=Aestuariivirga sp. TaxID=2650926 RepID=UPI003BAB9915